MNDDQFLALAKLLRLRAGAGQEAARLVLVCGLSVKEAEAQTGLTYGATYKAVDRARKGLVLARQVVCDSLQ